MDSLASLYPTSDQLLLLETLGNSKEGTSLRSLAGTNQLGFSLFAA